MKENLVIEHGLHTFTQGVVKYCPERLQGLLHQCKKQNWNVVLQKSKDLEKIKIFACDQLLYENKEFLLKADFQTDGELDPLVIEAVKVVKEKTDKMVDI